MSTTTSAASMRRRASGSFAGWWTRDRILIAVILGVALVIRAAVVLATRHSYQPVLDAADFSRIAASISNGHGFGHTSIPTLHGPSAFRTPLWPTLLAGVYWVVGVKFTAARLLLALLGAALVGLIGAVSWTILGRRVGLIAMGLAAIYPPLILAGYGLNYEVVMGVLVFSALLAILRWRTRPASWLLLVITGVLCGLAVLCRENAGLVIIPVVILMVQTLRPQLSARAIVSRIGVVILCAVAVVVPWTVRNAVQLHAFIPVSDSPNIAILGTYNATSASLDGMWIPYGGSTNAHIAETLPKNANEAQFADKEESAALTYIGHHPLYVVKVAFYNTLRFFDLRGPTDSNWLAPLIPWPLHFIEIAVVSFYVVAAIGLYGLFTRRIRGVPWALWTFPALWFVTIALSSSTMQYRFIVEPFFLLLAAVTLSKVVRPNGSTPASADEVLQG